MERELFLGNAYPNPFNPCTTIEYALPATGHVRLSVYDLSGRLVCRLVDGVVPAGYHATVWHGRDAVGRGVSSGTYFSRLEVGDEVLIRRMMLVK